MVYGVRRRTDFIKAFFRSFCPSFSTVKSWCNFTYAHKKSTAFPALISTKLANVCHHSVHICCTHFHHNPITHVGSTGKNLHNIRSWVQHGLQCVDWQETHNHSLIFVDISCDEILYRWEAKCRKAQANFHLRLNDSHFDETHAVPNNFLRRAPTSVDIFAFLGTSAA